MPGRLPVFVKHVCAARDGQNGAEGGEEVSEEADENKDKTACGEHVAEVKIEHDAAEIGEIGDGGDAGDLGHAAGDADESDSEDADEYRALDVESVENDHEEQAADGEENRGGGDVAERNAIGEAADAGVFEAEIRNEEADGCGYRDLEVLRNDADDQITESEHGKSNENDAGYEGYQHRGTEADRLRLDHCAEDEIGAHTGGQCEGKVGVECHEHSDKAGNEGAAYHYCRFADDDAVDINDRRIASADSRGLYRQNVCHGHKGSKAGNNLCFDIGTALAELEKFLHDLLLFSFWFDFCLHICKYGDKGLGSAVHKPHICDNNAGKNGQSDDRTGEQCECAAAYDIDRLLNLCNTCATSAQGF